MTRTSSNNHVGIGCHYRPEHVGYFAKLAEPLM